MEEAPIPEVSVSVIETEALGEIPKEAKKRTSKEDPISDTLGTA